MKFTKAKIGIIAGGLLAVAVIVSGVIFGNRMKKVPHANKINAIYDIKDLDLKAKRDTVISVDGGNYNITRNEIKSTAPMGEDKWTIFIYMCGSDLEGWTSQGSSDIEEMLSAQYGDNVRIVIQTGGSSRWENSQIDKTKFQRFLIEGNELKEVDSKDVYNNGDFTASMGNPDELYDFLSWGIDKYASNHMGLMFWNHGATVLEGLCFDMNCKNDPLKIPEVELALNKVSKKMTDKFEFIGLDCCEMQSIEFANMVVPYADYLIGSESSETCNGWYYTDFISYLGENKQANVEEMGKIIIDSSAEHTADEIIKLTKEASKSRFAMSMIDLSKVDDFLKEFHYVSKDLNDTIGKSNYYDIIGRVYNAPKFKLQSDLGAMLDNLKDVLPSAESAISKYNEMVKYFKISDGIQAYPRATGIGIIIQTGKHFDSMIDICVNPYYLNYLAYMKSGALQLEAEKVGKVEKGWENSTQYYQPTFEFLKLRVNNADADAKSGDNLFYILDEMSEVKCIKEPKVTDNHYSMTVDPSSMSYIADARVKIFKKVKNEAVGEDVYIDIVDNKNITMDKESGIISENISDKCLTLPNGLILNMELVETFDIYERYASKCFIKDKYATLYTLLNTKDGKIEVEGYSIVNEDSLMLDRELLQVQSGDLIEPMFNYTTDLTKGKLSSDTEASYGYYNVEGELELNYNTFEDDTYYCVIVLEDVYGNDIYTKDARFKVENGKLIK